MCDAFHCSATCFIVQVILHRAHVLPPDRGDDIVHVSALQNTIRNVVCTLSKDTVTHKSRGSKHELQNPLWQAFPNGQFVSGVELSEKYDAPPIIPTVCVGAMYKGRSKHGEAQRGPSQTRSLVRKHCKLLLHV